MQVKDECHPIQLALMRSHSVTSRLAGFGIINADRAAEYLSAYDL